MVAGGSGSRRKNTQNSRKYKSLALTADEKDGSIKQLLNLGFLTTLLFEKEAKRLTGVKVIPAGEDRHNRSYENRRNRKEEVSRMMLSPPLFAANFKAGLGRADLGREKQWRRKKGGCLGIGVLQVPTLKCFRRLIWGCDKLADVYVASQKDISGSLFAFVKFANVRGQESIEEIIEGLKAIEIRRKRFLANCTKHPRPTMQAAPKRNVAKGVDAPIKLDCMAEVNNWADKSVLVGEVRNFDPICNLLDLFALEGYEVVEIKYVGGIQVTVKFKSARAAEVFKANKTLWLKWFIWVELFQKARGTSSRLACSESDDEKDGNSEASDNIILEDGEFVPESQAGAGDVEGGMNRKEGEEMHGENENETAKSDSYEEEATAAPCYIFSAQKRHYRRRCCVSVPEAEAIVTGDGCGAKLWFKWPNIFLVISN
ncbi:hypothetical protein LXL04_015749 [Taraxacum kok-saghyz]